MFGNNLAERAKCDMWIEVRSQNILVLITLNILNCNRHVKISNKNIGGSIRKR